MAKKRFPITEPGCWSCEFYKNMGVTRYCDGFKKLKNPKRFSSSDPKLKAPKWCPKRLDHPVVRVYRYKNAMSRHFGESYMNTILTGLPYVFPSERHYMLVSKIQASVTAQQLYEEPYCDEQADIKALDLQHGDVIALDNGLMKYCFYNKHGRLVPAYFSPNINGEND